MGLKFYEFGVVSVFLYICSKVLLLLPIELAENIDIVSQATPFAERKGLVMLQLSSCCRGMHMLNIAVR